ncbi:hypothetical protein [Planomonospora venezuelensis]|uniref:Lipoprotein n=1 Tax=Planomonospora venezuelensis TaxID=1999 RepID=A0A841D687_PLAVE|nr:hypothetical protein [Planomonospora venezuelensis]MBB5964014.1 hypothetical protein [Planomonospora venezuelensis]GIN05050.1 hypothetical protein Pve01_67080 [Planomonospora venezuelensis]
MKRLILGLACVSAAALAVPALTSAAHAQAADPLTALKSQFGTGRGVSFSETTKAALDGERRVTASRTGVLQFGRSGITAYDHTAKTRIKRSDVEALTEDSESVLAKMLRGLSRPERVVRVNNAYYLSGGAFGEFLPADKTWLRFPEATNGVTGSMSQLVNVAEPTTLKALLARATKQAGGYTGKTTFGELYKVSPWFRASVMDRPSAKEAKTVVTWKLSLGSDQLATRLTTSYTERSGSDKMVVTVETRYTGWGSKVTVKAPAAGETATIDELEGLDEETATELPTQIN